MSKADRAQEWDIMLARRDIARHGGKYPIIYARRRLVELSAKPWADYDDWAGRVAAYDQIAKGLISHVEIQRD